MFDDPFALRDMTNMGRYLRLLGRATRIKVSSHSNQGNFRLMMHIAFLMITAKASSSVILDTSID